MNMTATPTEDELTLVAAKFFNMVTLLFLLGKTPEEIKEMCEHYFDLVMKHADTAKVHVFVDEAGRQLLLCLFSGLIAQTFLESDTV